MREIIINADDYGYTDGVSEGILELLRTDCVSSTSVMTAAQGAHARIQRLSHENFAGRVGVHLQLTGGSPLSSRGECPDLHSAGGTFADPRVSVRPPVAQVAIEWRRQIDLAIDLLGEQPSHLDTHHGMHRLPEYFDLYLELASELGIPVRGPLDSTQIDRMRLAGVRGSTLLIRGWTGTNLGLEGLIAHLEEGLRSAAPGDVVELITHPGRVDEHLNAISTMNETRAVEMAALIDLRESHGLDRLGLQLATARSLD